MTAFPDPVSHRRIAAYWYAVGRYEAALEEQLADESLGVADEPGYTPEPASRDLSDAFSRFAEIEAEAYYSSRSTFLPSIPDQWRRFTSVDTSDGIVPAGCAPSMGGEF